MIGVVMLVHTALDRAEQVIRFWAAGGCPVVVHVDKPLRPRRYKAFRQALSDLPQVSFSERFRCEWGSWGMVAATQAACTQMLARHPQVDHVYLMSGACLPLRPVADLQAYLDAHPATDFIESATTADVPWTVGGLSEERFTLRFPFSWKRHRRAFDRYVALQRRIGFKRRIPAGIDPHMGSQWWCLTRATLTAILDDPDRATYERYFQKVWIPDESYFQTMARRHVAQRAGAKIESRSLTLSKFDFQGKPHVFYDDHLQLLSRSDCFVARKIWPHAGRLYEAFLNPDSPLRPQVAPSPGKIDNIFSRAARQRTRGRPGLYMQSRLPNAGWENGTTAAPYSVFEGFSDLFPDFESWLAKRTGATVHGHIMAPDRVAFEGGQTHHVGALSDNAALRDYAPKMFLRNLIWNGRDGRQIFQFGPTDNQAISGEIAADSNAEVHVISGAWAITLFKNHTDPATLRAEAARLQRREDRHITDLRAPWAKARVRIWTLAEFMEAPHVNLQGAIADIPVKPGRPDTALPALADLTGFGQFLQDLKNQGMHPYLMGDFAIDAAPPAPVKPKRKPYLMK